MGESGDNSIGAFVIDSCCTWPHVAHTAAVWDIQLSGAKQRTYLCLLSALHALVLACTHTHTRARQSERARARADIRLFGELAFGCSLIFVRRFARGWTAPVISVDKSSLRCADLSVLWPSCKNSRHIGRFASRVVSWVEALFVCPYKWLQCMYECVYMCLCVCTCDWVGTRKLLFG